ncbi:hypothetical protein V6N11_014014 [Hibiscus sabdariffa]|uniref:Uncharacterized protein n=1 Tax=Hibiscus sabdariffa TaxID=183260 RepID=A0ABR2AFS1_9ROSI
MRKPLTTRILLQARGWLVGKVSLGRNGPIRITSFESSRCRSESSTFGFEALSRPDAVGFSGSSGNEILCPSQSLKSQACLTAEVGPRTKSSGNQDRASSFAVRTLTSNKERPGGLAPGVPLREYPLGRAYTYRG